ncbi:MAG: aspartate aminotransferase family protein [Firmicutes bacterium]|nr:aspartate aminotransferase family protein [Bacillota bacterium]
MEEKRVLYSALHKEYPVIDHGEGMYIYDTTGKKYLDCAAGIAVVNVGHGVKEILDKIHAQLDNICFVYGGTFTSETRERLAKKIIDVAPEGMDKVFLCSGGSEAMESLIKFTRQYQVERGKLGKYKVISRWQSYHGNTLGTLSLGGRPSWREHFDELFPKFISHIPACNCYRCPYGLTEETCNCQCALELERTIKYEGPETVSAFVMEPVIGTTAAAVVPPKKYVEKVKEICDKYDVLFCVDEVITGFGRTGANFAVDHYGVTPDLIGFAKGLGSGYVPVGGVIVNKKIVDAIAAGSGALTHAFTFSGTPLACAGAEAVLDYIVDNDLVKRSYDMGEIFLEKLKALYKYPVVGDVRGLGLMLGIEFVQDKETKAPFEFNFSGEVSKYCFDNGVMVTGGVPGSADGQIGDAMQIAPPFIITEEDMDIVVDMLAKGIEYVMEKHGIA